MRIENKKEICSSEYLTYKRSFFPSFKRSFNIFGSFWDDYFLNYKNKAKNPDFDACEIFSDWEMTGRDITEAVNNFVNQSKNASSPRKRQYTNK